jgi:hypothetical protein
MGKGDIFFARMKENGSWGTAHNIGYPINTFNNELGMIVNAGGDMAYFASDRIKERDWIYTDSSFIPGQGQYLFPT